jgi:aspartyl/asparaginyl beta-hydroxylase (cupin superfamily)
MFSLSSTTDTRPAQPHCGPTNHRLRLHLPLLVPPGAALRVGDETRPWVEGKVLMLDDSFTHEVRVLLAYSTVLH